MNRVWQNARVKGEDQGRKRTAEEERGDERSNRRGWAGSREGMRGGEGTTGEEKERRGEERRGGERRGGERG